MEIPCSAFKWDSLASRLTFLFLGHSCEFNAFSSDISLMDKDYSDVGDIIDLFVTLDPSDRELHISYYFNS